MVLDPETGELVPAEDDEDEYEDEPESDDDIEVIQTKPVFVNLGQSKSTKTNLQVCVWLLVFFLSLFF